MPRSIPPLFVLAIALAGCALDANIRMHCLEGWQEISWTEKQTEAVGCRQAELDEPGPMVSAYIMKGSGDVVGDEALVQRMLEGSAQAGGATIEIHSNSVTQWKGKDARTVHYTIHGGPSSATGWMDFVPVKKNRVLQITRAFPHAEGEAPGDGATAELQEMAATLDVIDPSGGSGLKPSRMVINSVIIAVALWLVQRYQQRGRMKGDAPDV